MSKEEIEFIGREDTYSRSGVFHESDTILIIKIDNENNFKEGMQKLREQINHLVLLYSESFSKYCELQETYEKVVTNFTQEGCPEYVTFIEHIPEHLAMTMKSQ